MFVLPTGGAQQHSVDGHSSPGPLQQWVKIANPTDTKGIQKA